MYPADNNARITVLSSDAAVEVPLIVFKQRGQQERSNLVPIKLRTFAAFGSSLREMPKRISVFSGEVGPVFSAFTT
jgi:hypothetical protein